MNSFVVLGTDTDAGKTTFALLWLASHHGWHYWKPLETGDSDSDKVRRLVPEAIVHPPILSLREPVAPPLAASREGKFIPDAEQIAAAEPFARTFASEWRVPLLIETFGGPFSPLSDSELQINLIRELKHPAILIAPSRVGTIGVTLGCLKSLRANGVDPIAVVLMGEPDDYARTQIERHGGQPTYNLQPPKSWDIDGIRAAASAQLETLQKIGTNPIVSSWLQTMWDRDRRAIWHPYTSLRDPEPPLPVIGAENEFLHLADGRKIIDGISSWWTILHGHREPRLMAALHEAAQSFDHVLFAGVTHPQAIRVAEMLLQSTHRGGGRVFFSDNGSTAVEVALKMAYQFWCHRGEPQRTLFIGFENGYHGDTFGAMAVGRDPLFFGKFEPFLFRAERVPVSAERLDEALTKNSGKVAAVIIEPLVQGAGGMRMHSPSELKAIYETTKKHGVLFIADEVMTGCHRTGGFWAHQAASIAPDLICAAKTLAGGILPLAATIASQEIVAAFDSDDRERTFFHGHSFTAHPLACAIAAVNLDWLLRETPSVPARFEGFWKEALAPLRDNPKVRDVRIRGTIAAVEFDVPGGYLAESSREMRKRALDHGVLLRPLGNVLYAMPPFRTSPASLERIATAIKSAASLVPE